MIDYTKPTAIMNLWRFKIPVYQDEREFVLVLKLKDGQELIFAELGQYEDLQKDVDRLREVHYAIFHALMTQYVND